MAMTLRADLYNPQLFSAYTGFAFVENLSALKFARMGDANAPFVLGNSGLLKAAGNYVDNPKFQPIANLVTRRDNTNTGAATVLGMTTRNDIGVRVSHKIGPVVIAKSVVNQAGYTAEMLAQEIGNQGGKFWALQVRKILIGLVKAICLGMTSTVHLKNVYQATGVKQNLTSQLLAQALYLMGDSEKFNSAGAGWIFRSESVLDLVNYQQGQGVQGIADRAAAGYNPLTMGLDFAKANDPALVATNSSNFMKYYSIGVAPGLIDVEIEKLEFDEPWYNGTLENPGWYFRGDIEMMITIPGFAWDKTDGGVNPDPLTTLLTPAYWTPTYSDDREIGAILLEHNSSAA